MAPELLSCRVAKNSMAGRAKTCIPTKAGTRPRAAIFAEAVQHHRAGRLVQAMEHYQRLLVFEPDHAQAHNNLGVALTSLGRIGEAAEHYERAFVLQPNYAEAHNNLGVALAALGRNDEAIAHYERALLLKPDYAEAHNNLGLGFAAEGRNDEAVAHYERAVILKPDYADAHYNLGVALAALGRNDEAIAHYEQALHFRPYYAEAHNNLGILLAASGQSDSAVAHYQHALAVKPHFAEAHNNLGNVLKSLGQLGTALAHYGRAIALRPAYAEAHYGRAGIKKFRQGDSDLAALEALANGNVLPANKMGLVHFALAKALEDCGDYRRAFEHLHKGNGLKRTRIDYNEATTLKLFQHHSEVFQGSLFERFGGEGDPSSVPIFVVGMPRSGTTLVEQILASHPQIHGAGELQYLEETACAVLKAYDPLFRYPECVPHLDGTILRRIGQCYLARLPVAPAGKTRIVDKLPGNFLNIGLIHLALPNARIVHTLRHPIDTCISCYSQLFAQGQYFSYDLAELGRYYRAYHRLMAHWRSVLPPSSFLDVSYENVVNDLEGEARRLISYCGLPWDDRCIKFHETARVVKTASSVQVRTPLYRSSLERWRRYEANIDPLLQELRDVIPG
ncbi:MAG: hypothetical protein C5B51_05800 [Terriglobia bacterium]|nr:MAG: hypothetical protein C5B51_05800 [Terriglobia bacterium]